METGSKGYPDNLPATTHQRAAGFDFGKGTYRSEHVQPVPESGITRLHRDEVRWFRQGSSSGEGGIARLHQGEVEMMRGPAVSQGYRESAVSLPDHIRYATWRLPHTE